MNKAERYRLASSVQNRPLEVRGCAVISAVLFLSAVALALTRTKLALFLTLPAVILFFHALYGRSLLFAAGRQGIQGVVVTSESPLWKARIEQEWLPRMPSSFEVLNWSTRRKPSRLATRLAWRLHSRFAGQYREYCPVVIVLRGNQYPAIFRFYRAFKESAQGRPEALAALESQLFAALSRAA